MSPRAVSETTDVTVDDQPAVTIFPLQMPHKIPSSSLPFSPPLVFSISECFCCINCPIFSYKCPPPPGRNSLFPSSPTPLLGFLLSCCPSSEASSNRFSLFDFFLLYPSPVISPSFLSKPSSFRRGGSVKIFCQIQQQYKGRFCQNFLFDSQFYKGRFCQNFLEVLDISYTHKEARNLNFTMID
jgi:hypothetical protein